jgi:hypothetical protein
MNDKGRSHQQPYGLWILGGEFFYAAAVLDGRQRMQQPVVGFPGDFRAAM